MEFKKYQHVERLGTESVEGILNGRVYVFPKLDGSNTGIYLNDSGEIEVNSRNRILSEEKDNAGVFAYVKSQEKFKNYLEKYPNHRLFGEWLVPHSIKYYQEDAWRKIYIFDVMEKQEDGNEKYLECTEYIPLLKEFDVQYIPPIVMLLNPEIKDVVKYQDNCNFLMKDNLLGEGIVIKNYDFVNKFGHIVWAKSVRNRSNKNDTKIKNNLINSIDSVEKSIVEKFLTHEFVEKEFSKIVIENNGWESKLIGKLFKTIWYTFISEEIFNILKKFKNPKVDFSLLQKLVVDKIKLIKSDIFA